MAKPCIICKDREAVIPKRSSSYCVPCQASQQKATNDARMVRVYKKRREHLRTLFLALDQIESFRAKYLSPETIEDRKLLEAIKWIRRLS